MNKIILSSYELNKIISRIYPVVNNNPIVPILENILFVVEEGELTATASNLQIIATSKMNVESSTNFSFCTTASTFKDFLSNLAEQPIELLYEDESQMLKITYETGQCVLPCEDANDFPLSEFSTDFQTLKVDSLVLLDAYANAKGYTSKDEMKAALTGMNIKFDSEKIIFACTDGHRLFTDSAKLDNNTSEGSVIIPSYAMNILEKFIDKNEIEILISDSHAKIIMSDRSVQFRLIEERYPDFENVIPKNADHEIVINKSRLNAALQRVGVFANKNTKQVRFEININEMSITAEDTSFSKEAIEKMPIKGYTGEEPFEIGFNIEFLKHNLTKFASEEFILKLTTPNKAAVLQEENSSALYLLMPIMLHR